jgi:hypothetical protein
MPGKERPRLGDESAGALVLKRRLVRLANISVTHTAWSSSGATPTS